jgi:hypothetical protein
MDVGATFYSVECDETRFPDIAVLFRETINNGTTSISLKTVAAELNNYH